MRNDADAVACSCCAAHQVFILRVWPQKGKQQQQKATKRIAKKIVRELFHMENESQTIGFSRSRSRSCCWI